MIDVSIRNWLQFTSTLALPQIKQAPYRGDRPDGDYITYQVMDIIPSRVAFKHAYAQVGDSNQYDWSRFTHAEMTVSANCYSPSGQAIIHRVIQSNDWWEARNVLKAQGVDVVYVDSSGVRDLTGIGDESFRSRHQTDLRFNIVLNHQRTIDAIIEWHLTGKFSSGENPPSQEVQSNINYVS